MQKRWREYPCKRSKAASSRGIARGAGRLAYEPDVLMSFDGGEGGVDAIFIVNIFRLSICSLPLQRFYFDVLLFHMPDHASWLTSHQPPATIQITRQTTPDSKPPIVTSAFCRAQALTSIKLCPRTNAVHVENSIHDSAQKHNASSVISLDRK